MRFPKRALPWMEQFKTKGMATYHPIPSANLKEFAALLRMEEPMPENPVLIPLTLQNSRIHMTIQETFTSF